MQTKQADVHHHQHIADDDQQHLHMRAVAWAFILPLLERTSAYTMHLQHACS